MVVVRREFVSKGFPDGNTSLKLLLQYSMSTIFLAASTADTQEGLKLKPWISRFTRIYFAMRWNHFDLCPEVLVATFELAI
jgi:hypothetical protein